ncbi:MAG: ABC transporter permease [Methanocalculus sp. MSAO_Arc1]|uniref:ABC transporter permease n=1 Tax=Methanocalculus TaxID=71151 RepID=UPI000FF35675|nr:MULTISPECIES: ABC transporter permease [unclassified Methanocalculus]MCP1661694.1 ABC-2 type transport system permease protein [Methanocalculus sp. AMF5]RQD81436.1 MAG: ABC transporter permease [Methanocalculus sp. MSAO_Arc1]
MNPDSLPEQLRRAFAITKKDIRIYYAKGPVVIFGLFMPLFLFLAFAIGDRGLPMPFLLSGLLAMTVFFTATAVSPVIQPWEAQARTLERLIATPVTMKTLIAGDMFASVIFGIGIAVVPITIGLLLGVVPIYPLLLAVGIILASFCFSALGLLLSTPATNVPSNIMMLSALLKFPLIFISGVFIPVEQLPFAGQVLAICSPLTYFTDIARYCLMETQTFPLWVNFAALALFAILFTTAAMVLHTRTVSRRI